MAIFWKVTAFVLIAAILVVTTEKEEKDIAILLSVAACTMVIMTTCTVFEPVISFLHKLEVMADLQSGVLRTILKIAGIGLIYEITEMILSDSGNTALAKGIQLFSSAIILNISIPIFDTFLNLLQQILGAI